MKIVHLGFVTFCLVAVSGCAVARSTHVPLGSPSAVEGMPYALPQTELTPTLTVTEITKVDPKTKKPVGTGEYTIKLELASRRTADAGRRYVLTQVHNILYSDTIGVKIGSDNLLQSVNTEADDKSAAIAERLGSIAVSVANVLAALPTPAARVRPGGPPPTSGVKEALARLSGKPYSEPVALSSLPSGQYKLIQSFPDSGGVDRLHLLLRVDPVVSSSAIANATKPDPVSETSGDGVFFRVASPYGFDLALSTSAAFSGASTPMARLEGTVHAPDDSPTFLFPLSRSPFVKTTDALVFSDGMLVQIDSTRPSEVLGFLNIPLAIAEKAALIPAGVLGQVLGTAPGADDADDADDGDDGDDDDDDSGDDDTGGDS